MLADVDTDPPPPAPWGDRIGTMAPRLRAPLGDHPSALPLTLTHRHRSPAGLRWPETVLALLAGAGVGERERVLALRSLPAYVSSRSSWSAGPLSGTGTAAVARLPADAFASMAATARRAREVGPGAEAFGGLDLLLRCPGG